jgi:hypothetical protein
VICRSGNANANANGDNAGIPMFRKNAWFR